MARKILKISVVFRVRWSRSVRNRLRFLLVRADTLLADQKTKDLLVFVAVDILLRLSSG